MRGELAGAKRHWTIANSYGSLSLALEERQRAGPREVRLGNIARLVRVATLCSVVFTWSAWCI